MEVAKDLQTMSSVAEERNFGPQPLAELLTRFELKPHDLVSASKEQLTHKMVSKGGKGRRLTRRVQVKIVNALNALTEATYQRADLFNYE